MSDRTVRMSIELPLADYRRLTYAAARRDTTIGAFAASLITERVKLTSTQRRVALRRKQVAELLELNYSCAEIARRLGVGINTIYFDRDIIQKRKASA